MSEVYEATGTLGQVMFGQADFGDRRRAKRLARTFDQMRRHPGGTLPDKLSSPADLKGFYRFCASPWVTHEGILEPMREYAWRRVAEADGPILILHDATELDYTSIESLADQLGQIGRGTRRGYVCHNVLAVDASASDVLGLIDQIPHRRHKSPKNETLDQRRNRETRESLLWVKGTRHLPRDPRLIDVADQGASTFEFLEHETKSGRRFIIRNGQVRGVLAGHDPAGSKTSLKEHVNSLPEQRRFTMDVQPQRGRKARVQAEFALRGGPILLLPPHARCGLHGDDPLPLYVAYVVEVSEPPAGEKPIEWTLLTNEPVHAAADAMRVVGWYKQRWVIEEYHKAMKTGCQIEDLQLTAVERLQPAIALLSAVALTLLNLRAASRRPDAATRPASELISNDYVEVLRLWRYRQPRADLTVRDFFLALARLGGHQNRKHDHPPAG